jgi:hypothetical protein
MDLTLRKNLQRYRATQDAWDHARVIKQAIRIGELDADRVALCAYLGDLSCKNVFFNFIRNNCFLYFEHALKNREPRDIIPHVRKWGGEATIKAACGAIKALARSEKPHLNLHGGPLSLFAMYAHTHVPRRPFGLPGSPQWKNTTVEIVETKIRTVALAHRSLHSGRAFFAARAFKSLRWDITNAAAFPGIRAMIVANGHLDDDKMLTGMLEYIKPWALGEYI